MTVFVIILLIVIILLVFTILFLKGSHTDETKEMEAEKTEMIRQAEEREAKANAKKETIETGDNITDFDNSLGLMHDLSQRNY